MNPSRYAALTTVIFLLFIPSAGAGAEGRGFMDLLDGWEYRWGDSPIGEAGIPAWATDPSGEWTPIGFPSNPPDRDGREYVWYRVPLPVFDVRDLALFVYSVDTAMQVYLDGRMIYQFGDFSGDSPPSFAGWPWHMIDIENGRAGEYLSFRVYSDYIDIGLWGNLMLGSETALFELMVKRDFPRIGIGMISLFLAAMFLLLYLFERGTTAYAYLALSIVPIGLRILLYTQVKQLYPVDPLVYEFLKAGTYFIIPVGFTLLIGQIIAPRYRKLINVLWILPLVYFTAALSLSAAGAVRISATYVVYDFLYAAIIGVLCVLGIVAARQGNVETKILSTSSIVMSLSSLYSVFVANGIVPWTDEFNYIIMFLFILTLSFILIRRIIVTRHALERTTGELKLMATTLEQKVEERTYQLEEANRLLKEEKDSLQISSITDDLTGLYNRRYIEAQLKRAISEASRYRRSLSVVMMDLDHFKQLNDSWGHLMGDSVLRRVGATLLENLRESDFAGRFGGEEFLLILPGTDVVEGGAVAERIRRRVETLAWDNPEIGITISGGIAPYEGEDLRELLNKADILLYAAKTRGRNRIESAEGRVTSST